MDKYAVDENKDLKKTAGEDPTCPTCGSRLTQHGNILLCPNCGSVPFEIEDETESESSVKK